MRTAAALLLLLLLPWGLAPVRAAPSTFPETALSLHGGAFYGSNAVLLPGGGVRPGLSVGVEALLPVRYLDVSATVAADADLDGTFGARLSGSALVFSTVGTQPPLALGLGADLGLRGGVVSAHLGPVVGLDLLFVSSLPVTVSLYVAPGVAFGRGVSLAWTLEGRYYLDGVALSLRSSERVALEFGVRLPLQAPW